MMGRHAVVLDWTADEGWVRCGAEKWHAVGRTGGPERVGDGVRVVGVHGLTLEVEPEKVG